MNQKDPIGYGTGRTPMQRMVRDVESLGIKMPNSGTSPREQVRSVFGAMREALRSGGGWAAAEVLAQGFVSQIAAKPSVQAYLKNQLLAEFRRSMPGAVNQSSRNIGGLSATHQTPAPWQDPRFRRK